MSDFKMNDDWEWLRQRAEAEDGCFVSVGGWVTELAQTEPVTCPTCGGVGSAEALLHLSHGGCEQRRLPCSTCKGQKTITAEHAERIRRGEEMRQDRLKRGLSGREEAKRLGMDPIALNHLEHGREP